MIVPEAWTDDEFAVFVFWFLMVYFAGQIASVGIGEVAMTIWFALCLFSLVGMAMWNQYCEVSQGDRIDIDFQLSIWLIPVAAFAAKCLACRFNREGSK